MVLYSNPDMASVCHSHGIMKCYVEHRSGARLTCCTVCRRYANVSDLINQAQHLLALVKAYCRLTFRQTANLQNYFSLIVAAAPANPNNVYASIVTLLPICAICYVAVMFLPGVCCVHYTQTLRLSKYEASHSLRCC